jgi:hypothetical protein
MPSIIYQEKLPRILLIDFPKDLASQIVNSPNLNFKTAEIVKELKFPIAPFGSPLSNFPKGGFGVLEESGETVTFSIPRPTNEFDIVILNADYSLLDLRSKGLDKSQPFASSFQGPSSPRIHCTKLFADTIGNNGGIFLVFVGENAKLGTARFLGTSLTFEHTGFDVATSPYTIVEPDNVFHPFIESNLKELRRIPAITATGINDCTPLIQDDQNPRHIYAAVFLNSALIVLPHFSDLPGKIAYLMAKVLPKLRPNLFPDVKDWAYLNDPAYLPKEITEILKQNQAIADERDVMISKNLQKIEAIRKSRDHLIKLLSSKGHDLHLACQKTLEEIFEKFDADLQVINVDVNDDMKNVDRRRKEDLRIPLPENKVALVDVKGTESNFGHGVINEMDEHRNIFLRYHRDFRPEDVFSVAILNNQPSVDPRNRDGLFGPRTGEIQERLLKVGYSAMSTAELFRLHRWIFCEGLRPKLPDFLERLTKPGINTFEDILGKVED